MLRSNKGFSYIEVLISSLLLSIFLIPLTMAFFNLSINFKYSKLFYDGMLQCKSLMLDFQTIIEDGDDSNFISFINENYDTESFDFGARVIEVTNDGLSEGVTYSINNVNVPIVSLSTEQINLLRPFSYETFDTNMYEVISVSNGEENIEVNADTAKPVILLIDFTQSREVNIFNKSSRNIFIKAYLYENVSNEDVTINILQSNGNVLVEYLKKQPIKKSYILSTSVFTKEKNEILTIHKILEV